MKRIPAPIWKAWLWCILPVFACPIAVTLYAAAKWRLGGASPGQGYAPLVLALATGALMLAVQAVGFAGLLRLRWLCSCPPRR